MELALTRQLLRHEVTAVAYENVEQEVEGRAVFPLLSPMSRIAGTQSLRGAYILHNRRSKKKPRVVIIGGGVVGEAALREAIEKKVASIVLFELNLERMHNLRQCYAKSKGGDTKVKVFPMQLMKTPGGLATLTKADIVISGVMNPGGSAAPKVLTASEFAVMKSGTIIVDVAIDQGGSTEWSKTTHSGETFEQGGLIFSCTTNIPGSVPHEATLALTNATLPYVKLFVEYARKTNSSGWWLLKDRPDLRRGLQTWRGLLTNQFVAEKHGIISGYKPLKFFFD